MVFKHCLDYFKATRHLINYEVWIFPTTHSKVSGKVQINIFKIVFYLPVAIIRTTHYINYIFFRATNHRIFKLDRIDGTKYRALWDTDT